MVWLSGLNNNLSAKWNYNSNWYFVTLCVPLFFIRQELNVRQMTMSTDKGKYGIHLRAEPDHMVLGKRLKGAFKAITASIKELNNEHLETFQKTGIDIWCYLCKTEGTKYERITLTEQKQCTSNSWYSKCKLVIARYMKYSRSVVWQLLIVLTNVMP